MPKQPKEDPKPKPDHKSEPLTTTKPPRKSFWGLKKPQSKGEWVFTVFGALVVLTLIALAVPYSRYGILGQFFKRPATVKVLDSRTHKPVSDVEIAVGSQRLKTDAKGEAKLGQVPVGGWQVVASKKFYNLVTTNIMVPLFSPVKEFQLDLVAIGNQVTVKVTNKITGKGLAKATLSALGTTATTDTDGNAVLVLPVDKDKVDGTVKLDGYNLANVTVTNAEGQNSANNFSLVPSGKVYFLSKRTGVINVMKSDLDGSNPEVVVAGTGKENDTQTVLVSTRDWKYLALKAQRDSDRAKLFLINTTTDKMTLIDQGVADFTITGWYDHYFVYSVSRNEVPYGQANGESLKSYDADTDHLTNLASNSVGESINNPGFFGEELIFSLQERSQSGQIKSIGFDGNGGKILKTVPSGQGLGGPTVVSPTKFDYYIYNAGPKTLYFQQDSQGNETPIDSIPGVTDRSVVPYYLQSPGENQTFWYDPRDGKNTLFIGDDKGENGKEIASLSDYKPYGWYTDDYLLVSKNDSELYIAPADFSAEPVKITDYHKPAVTFNGYGGGYGGQ